MAKTAVKQPKAKTKKIAAWIAAVAGVAHAVRKPVKIIPAARRIARLIAQVCRHVSLMVPAMPLPEKPARTARLTAGPAATATATLLMKTLVIARPNLARPARPMTAGVKLAERQVQAVTPVLMKPMIPAAKITIITAAVYLGFAQAELAIGMKVYGIARKIVREAVAMGIVMVHHQLLFLTGAGLPTARLRKTAPIAVWIAVPAAMENVAITPPVVRVLKHVAIRIPLFLAALRIVAPAIHAVVIIHQQWVVVALYANQVLRVRFPPELAMVVVILLAMVQIGGVHSGRLVIPLMMSAVMNTVMVGLTEPVAAPAAEKFITLIVLIMTVAAPILLFVVSKRSLLLIVLLTLVLAAMKVIVARVVPAQISMTQTEVGFDVTLAPLVKPARSPMSALPTGKIVLLMANVAEEFAKNKTKTGQIRTTALMSGYAAAANVETGPASPVKIAATARWIAGMTPVLMDVFARIIPAKQVKPVLTAPMTALMVRAMQGRVMLIVLSIARWLVVTESVSHLLKLYRLARRIVWGLAGIRFVMINITLLPQEKSVTIFVRKMVVGLIVALIIDAATDAAIGPMTIVPSVPAIAAIAAATESVSPNTARVSRPARRIVWLFAGTANATPRPGRHA